MCKHTPRGVRRYGRVGAIALVASSLLAGGVATASSASAATTASTAMISQPLPAAAPVPIGAHAYLAATRVTSYAGQAIKLTGRVVVGRYGRLRSLPVRLQQRSGSTWKTISAKPLSKYGYVTYWVRPQRTIAYRLVFPARSPYAASTSSVLTITVKAATASSRAANVLAIVAAQSGKWYSYGAAGPSTFDCSGLTYYVFKKVGVSLPHNANAQTAYGRSVSRSAALPGDLVFFLSGGYAYHVGIYAGGGYMYDAPHSGVRVGKHKIWGTNVSFRRIV